MKKILLLLAFLFSSTAMAAETSIEGLVAYPPVIFPVATEYGLLDAADEKIASIFKFPKSGTAAGCHFKTGTVTTGADLDVRIETVSGLNLNPTGTLLCTNSNGTQTVNATDDNTWFTTSVTSGCSVSPGDLAACVIVNPSGSPGDLNILESSAYYRHASKDKYSKNYTTSWGAAEDYPSPAIIPFYSGSDFEPMWLIPGTINSDTIGNNSTPDEIGNIFQVPVPARVVGYWVVTDKGNGDTSDFDVVLYDSDGSSTLASVSLTDDYVTDANDGQLVGFFTSTASISKDTNYRIVVKPTSTNVVQIWHLDVDSSSLAAFGGNGNIKYTSRTDAGSWTENSSKFAMVGIIIDAFDDGVGGGGGGSAGGVWGF